MELNDVLEKTAEDLGLDRAACNQLQDKREVRFERLNDAGEWAAGLWHFILPQSRYRVAKDQTDVARQALVARFWHQPATPAVSELAPLAQEWLSASKVCAFEPAEGTAFTHRWDGFEVESDAGHVPSFPMAGKWGMSSGADDYGRTTFRNPLKD